MTSCSICGPCHTPEIHQASLSVRGWLKERMSVVMSAPSVDVKAPKRLKPTPTRNPVMTAPNVRKPRKSEIAAKAKKPRAARVRARTARSAGSSGPWNVREDITIEAIVECWRQRMSIKEIAAKFDCNRSAISKRICAARSDEEFRALELEFTTCPKCKGIKCHYHPVCRECSRRTGGKPGSNGGHNRRQDVTVHTIVECWQAGMTSMEAAKKLNCTPKMLYDRVKAAKSDPAIAELVNSLRTCHCGKRKASGGRPLQTMQSANPADRASASSSS